MSPKERTSERLAQIKQYIFGAVYTSYEGKSTVGFFYKLPNQALHFLALPYKDGFEDFLLELRLLEKGNDTFAEMELPLKLKPRSRLFLLTSAGINAFDTLERLCSVPIVA